MTLKKLNYFFGIVLGAKTPLCRLVLTMSTEIAPKYLTIPFNQVDETIKEYAVRLSVVRLHGKIAKVEEIIMDIVNAKENAKKNLACWKKDKIMCFDTETLRILAENPEGKFLEWVDDCLTYLILRVLLLDVKIETLNV